MLTAQERAVYNGHLTGGVFQGSRTETVQSLSLTAPFHFQRLSATSQIFVYLGPSHTRSGLQPFEQRNPDGLEIKTVVNRNFSIRVNAQGTNAESQYIVQIPLAGIMVNKPLLFTADDPKKVALVFEVYSHSKKCTPQDQIAGTGVFLLQNLREGLAPKRESLIRHYTVPIMQNGTMLCFGSVTFSILLIDPFCHMGAPPKPSRGFWQGTNSYPIVGHRGSGANSTNCTNLQIGENTFQSFLTAVKRGAHAVEFDVQLTKDYDPVIYHDFHVKETGGDVPLHGLTSDQFEHYSRSQAPRSCFQSSDKHTELLSHADTKALRRPRSHSVDVYDNDRGQDLIDRIKFTEEGLKGNFKGNLRGLSIQEPSTRLEQLLTRLPETTAFDLEIKYPMLWEAEDRSMEYFAIELNFYVDTILSMIFEHCGDRDITLSSFSPEVCIALACKQIAFPILLISKAGSVPVSDVRAGSLRGAIEFAKTWGLTGIVSLSDPFVTCPRLITYAKECGLVVCSYGELNNDPVCAMVQIEAGLDAIITDKAHLLSHSLAKVKR